MPCEVVLEVSCLLFQSMLLPKVVPASQPQPATPAARHGTRSKQEACVCAAGNAWQAV